MLNNKGGRPSTPAKIKELSGTIRKDRVNNGIEFDIITKVPKPQSWLDDKAKGYFRNICKLLIAKELLNDANVPLVLIMAQEFSTFQLACMKLTAEENYVVTSKSGVEHQSPWVGIRNNAQKNYKDIASLFGLDPLSASRVSVVKKIDADPFDAMQKKYS